MTDDPHYAYSESTDTWYRVHDYEGCGDRRIVAKGKTEVEPEEVPDDQRERIREHLNDDTNQVPEAEK